MSKRNEDSVERFFRKATSQYDNSFIGSDWEKMEKLLDQEAAKRAAGRSKNLKRGAFAGAALTGIMVLVYFLVSDPNHSESRLLTDNGLPKQMQAAAGAEAPSPKQKKENPSAALLFSLPDVFSLPDAQTSVDSKKVNTPAEKHHNETAIITTPASRAQLPSGIEGQNDDVSGIEPVLRQATDPEKNEEPPFITPGSDKARKKSSETESAKPELTEEEPAEEKLVKDAPEDDLRKPAELSSPKEKKPFSASRWNVALAIAPDFSSTSLDRLYSPGSAFGLLIGYNIHPRLAISTGMLKSSKKYRGNGTDYQPPVGYWQRRTNGIVPEYIDGRCKVVEIPIMIQYSIRQRERSRLFVSGGVSSYLMLSEAYDYTFEDPNPGAAKGWRSREASSQIFDIGHLSIGYEKQLTPKVSLGLEPFLKVPFSGIGWSNLDLFTTGAYINIRYRMFKKGSVLPGDNFKTNQR